LFRALLKSIEMPERWRNRLRHQFWRPRAFRELLDLLSGEVQRSRSSISAHVDAVAGGHLQGAVAHVEKVLGEAGVPLVGGRSMEDIAGRLLEKASDRSETPLTSDVRRRIDGYLAIAGPVADCATALHGVASSSPAFVTALDYFVRRLREIKKRRLAFDAAQFSAIFGRDLEYYTGFVFEIETKLSGEAVQIAGGGRYDSLMSDIGAPFKVPAVGCAIHTERLLAAIRAQT
jgi:ATP phosphoribosyltransferase regulatory subunit